MAITLVGFGSAISFANTSVVPLPSGIVNSDVLIIVCQMWNTPFAAPLGWTQKLVGQSTFGFYWKRASASETAPTVTGADPSSTAFMVAYRGCVLSGDPFEATSAIVNTVSPTTIAEITTTTPGAKVLAFAGYISTGATSWGTPTGVATNVVSTQILSGNGYNHGIGAWDYTQATPGTTGVEIISATGALYSGISACMTALKPLIGTSYTGDVLESQDLMSQDPIYYGSAPTLVGTGTLAIWNGGGSTTVPLPSGITINDTLLCCAFVGNPPATTPASNGWTLATSLTPPNGTIYVYWKRASASETAPTIGNGGGGQGSAFIVAYRGCYGTGNPFEFTGPIYAGSSVNTITVPSVNVGSTNAKILLLGCSIDTGTVTYSTPIGVTTNQVFQSCSFSGNTWYYAEALWDYTQISPGATGTTTITGSASATLYYNDAIYMVLLPSLQASIDIDKSIALKSTESIAPITHSFTSAISDGSDPSLVRPSDWNGYHIVQNQTFDRTSLSASAGLNTKQLAILRWYQTNKLGLTATQISGNPANVAFDGQNIWTVNMWGNSVQKVNVYTKAVTAVATVSGANGICSDGTYMWVPQYTGSVSKVKISDGTVTTPVTGLTQHLYGCCYDGANVWVTCYDGNGVYRINASTNTASGLIATGVLPVVCVTDGVSVWVSANTTSVYKVKIADNSKTTISMPTNSGINFVFDGTSVWTSSSSSTPTLVKINASTNAVSSVVVTGSAAAGAVGFDGRYIWYAVGLNAYKLDPITNSVVGGPYANPSTGTYTAIYNFCFDGTNMWSISGQWSGTYTGYMGML